MYQVSFQLKIFWTTHIKSFLHNSKHQDRVFFPLIMSKMTQNAKLFSSGGSCKLFKNILKKTKKKKKKVAFCTIQIYRVHSTFNCLWSL